MPGDGGDADLGAFTATETGAELDARTERLRLKAQDRFVAYMAPVGEGRLMRPFPVLAVGI